MGWGCWSSAGRLRGWSFRLADCLLSLFPRCELQQSFRGHGTFSALSTEVTEGAGAGGVDKRVNPSGQELGSLCARETNGLRRNGISSRSRCGGNLFVNRIVKGYLPTYRGFRIARERQVWVARARRNRFTATNTPTIHSTLPRELRRRFLVSLCRRFVGRRVKLAYQLFSSVFTCTFVELNGMNFLWQTFTLKKKKKEGGN